MPPLHLVIFTYHLHVCVSPLVELRLQELGGALVLDVLHPVLVDELLEAVAEGVGGQPVEGLGGGGGFSLTFGFSSTTLNTLP